MKKLLVAVVAAFSAWILPSTALAASPPPPTSGSIVVSYDGCVGTLTRITRGAVVEYTYYVNKGCTLEIGGASYVVPTGYSGVLPAAVYSFLARH